MHAHIIIILSHSGMTLHQTIYMKKKKDALPCRMIKTSTGLDDAGCYQPEHNESQFSRHILSHFHIASPLFTAEEKAWLLNNTNAFLYTIRDPIDRLTSAFYYHKHGYEVAKKDKNKIRFKYEGFNDRVASTEFFDECFHNGLNALLDGLRHRPIDKGSNSTKRWLRCKNIGRRVLQGKSGVAGVHFNYNYQYYRDYTLGKQPDHAVAVIRLENIWDDVITLDGTLGGSGKQIKGVGSRKTHGSENYAPENQTLSVANTMYLCCLVYKEIEVYQTLVLKAFNLNTTQKEETLSKLLDHCHIDKATVLPRLIPFPWQELYNKTNHCTTLEVLQ